MNQLNMYQGVNYKNIREKVQTIVLHLTDEAATSNHDTNTMFDTDHINFRVTLQEPMIIDELSDVYLEFVLSSNTKGNSITGGHGSAFILSIDQFNVNSVSNQSESYNKILIPNEHSDTELVTPANHVTLHKSKKLNYVCSINPCRLYELSGKLTILDGNTAFHNHSIPTTPSLPLRGTANTSPANAYDIGYLDTEKVLKFRVDVSTNQDTEIFLFKTAATATNIEDNTTLSWEVSEKSTDSGADASSFNDHNDDHPSHTPESMLTYTDSPSQLPKMHGYYWIAMAPYNTRFGVTPSATTTIAAVGAGMDYPVPTNSWATDPTLRLLVTEGSDVDQEYSNITAMDRNIYWFRFESTDHSKNFVSQFNMEPRSAMKFHQDSADKTYLNTGYTDKRTKRQTLVLDVTIGTNITFSVTLQEPLIIDSLSDVYLDSFTTFKTKNKLTNFSTSSPPYNYFQPSSLFYLLEIEQFNVRTNTNDPLFKDKIIIPNESTDDAKTFNHMSRKMNYICSINPTTLEDITGSIMNLESITIGTHSSTRFIAELVIVSREDDS
jgi:hypothetical protein